MELLDDKMRVWLESAKFVKPVSGVYILYNRNKEPIYIGEANNLEERFTKYVDTDFEGNEIFYGKKDLKNPSIILKNKNIL